MVSILFTVITSTIYFIVGFFLCGVHLWELKTKVSIKSVPGHLSEFECENTEFVLDFKWNFVKVVRRRAARLRVPIKGASAVYSLSTVM